MVVIVASYISSGFEVIWLFSIMFNVYYFELKLWDLLWISSYMICIYKFWSYMIICRMNYVWMLNKFMQYFGCHVISYDNMNLLWLLMMIVFITNALPHYHTLWWKYSSQLNFHVSYHLYKIYHEYFCYKIFATSSAMSLATSSYLLLTFSSQRFHTSSATWKGTVVWIVTFLDTLMMN
jgi:hypothetical protein